MSGDLEDFLKRAAQRRQANAAGKQRPQQGAGAARPRRPEYTNSRTERLPQAGPEEEPDEVVMAEILGDRDEPRERQQAAEKARKRAAEAEAEKSKKTKQPKQPSAKAQQGRPEAATAAARVAANPAQELMRMLKQPAGLRQAVLLKEILDRPEHRW